MPAIEFSGVGEAVSILRELAILVKIGFFSEINAMPDIRIITVRDRKILYFYFLLLQCVPVISGL
jgi:hypothetical protein